MSAPALPKNEAELVELLNRECARKHGNVKRVAIATNHHDCEISQQRKGAQRISERVAKHLGYQLRWVKLRIGTEGQS